MHILNLTDVKLFLGSFSKTFQKYVKVIKSFRVFRIPLNHIN